MAAILTIFIILVTLLMAPIWLNILFDIWDWIWELWQECLDDLEP